MYTLTKLDIAALRTADHFTVHLNALHPEGRVCVTKRGRPTEANPFAVDKDLLLPVPVMLHCEKMADKPRAECFASVWLYQEQTYHGTSLIRFLRAGDEIRLTFSADYHTSENLYDLGLHADVLLLCVRRGKQNFEFELDHSTGPENTARMCRNCSYFPWYARQKAKA